MKEKQFSLLLFVVILFVSSGCVSINNADRDDVMQNKKEQQSTGEGIQESTEVISKRDLKTFTIYAANFDTYKKSPVSKLEMEEAVPTIEKLKALADRLSEQVFKELPIIPVNVNVNEEKNIATINLKEIGNNEETSWQHYLNGSSALGMTTLTSLTATFFQIDEIDGIEILYNGKNDYEFDHFPVDKIFYKK